MYLNTVENEILPDMARSYRLLLGGLGENPDRQGLIKTPERAAKAMLYFTKGYDQSLEGKHISFGAINTRSVIQRGGGGTLLILGFPVSTN